MLIKYNFFLLLFCLGCNKKKLVYCQPVLFHILCTEENLTDFTHSTISSQMSICLILSLNFWTLMSAIMCQCAGSWLLSVNQELVSYSHSIWQFSSVNLWVIEISLTLTDRKCQSTIFNSQKSEWLSFLSCNIEVLNYDYVSKCQCYLYTSDMPILD